MKSKILMLLPVFRLALARQRTRLLNVTHLYY
jgi:hypothetical protein